MHIGTVLDGPLEVRDILEAYEREIRALTEEELDVRFEPEHQLVARWTIDSVRLALDTLLADPEVDLVLALGPTGSHLLGAAAVLPKPAIASLIVDPELQGLPIEEDQDGVASSGVTNLNYIARPATFERDLDTFLEMVQFRKLAVMADGHLVSSIAGLEERVRQITNARGLDYLYVPVGDSVAEALSNVPDDVDAVYLTPLLQLPSAEWDRLIRSLIERRLPTFSYMGEFEVRRGVLTGVGTEAYILRLARRVALNVQRILLGEDAGAIPVYFPVREQLSINMATARAIGFSPSWDQQLEAQLFDKEDETIERHLSLFSVVEEAIRANLDLVARSYGVLAGEQDQRLARSTLLPQLDVAALGVQIDEDRASSIFSTRPERSLDGFLHLQQVLYVEPLLANTTIQKHLQGARKADYDELRLDIALAASTTYLNLLRAKALERIDRENLRVTRSNLDLAQLRLQVGTAGEAEVVRWESKIALDRGRVVNARVERELAELAVNRLLNRPLEERFRTQEVGLEDRGLIVTEERFPAFIENPRRSRLVRDYMAAEGVTAAPEILALDELVAAQKRQLRSNRRAYWSPDIVFQAEVGERLAAGGAGSDRLDLGTVLPFDPGLPDDSLWSIAVEASLPLFAGGARPARVAQSDSELSELQAIRRSVAQQVELRIRAALVATVGSYQGIALAEAGAEAARRNLELVTDAYAQGALSILDLLDGQNSALVTEQLAADAVYGFLIDVMELQRAMNRFDFFLSGRARDDFLDRLDDSLRASGIALEDD